VCLCVVLACLLSHTPRASYTSLWVTRSSPEPSSCFLLEFVSVMADEVDEFNTYASTGVKIVGEAPLVKDIAGRHGVEIGGFAVHSSGERVGEGCPRTRSSPEPSSCFLLEFVSVMADEVDEFNTQSVFVCCSCMSFVSYPPCILYIALGWRFLGALYLFSGHLKGWQQNSKGQKWTETNRNRTLLTQMYKRRHNQLWKIRK
jgi:hypothetical protein